MTIAALNPTLTRAGMAALFSASNDGLSAKISHIAFGTGQYLPIGDEFALQSEQVRVSVAGGSYLADFEIELVARLDHDSDFVVSELGAYLEDGTLLALWSDPTTPLAHYTTGVPIALSFVLALQGIPPGSVEISGDLDLSLFFGAEFANMGLALTTALKMIVDLQSRVRHLEEQELAASLHAERLDAIQNVAIDARMRVAALEP